MLMTSSLDEELDPVFLALQLPALAVQQAEGAEAAASWLGRLVHGNQRELAAVCGTKPLFSVFHKRLLLKGVGHEIEFHIFNGNDNISSEEHFLNSETNKGFCLDL
jgi:hypothetical protein